MAETVQDLQVFQKALAAGAAISAILTRPAFRNDRDLASQLNRASIRIPSDIAEGFEQKTDRHFAKYLYDARGSANEVRVQLLMAVSRGHIEEGEREALSEMFAEVARMLTGLIRHLQRENRQVRQRFRRP